MSEQNRSERSLPEPQPPAIPPNLKLQPHHGNLILALGILGFVLPILAIPAWIMGTNDVNAMRAEKMDNSGYAATNNGRILGMIVCLFWIAVVVIKFVN